MVTRVPDAKFLNISREKGAKVVVVDPNYSPTAAKVDEWIQINPSTDAAFALGIVSVILDEKLHDEEFIKTNTDLPLLVRLDNQKKPWTSGSKNCSRQRNKRTIHDTDTRCRMRDV